MDTPLTIKGRDYVTTKVASELTGCSEAYVRQLAQGKWVEASCVKGQYYIELDALVRFLRLLEEEEAHSKKRSYEPVPSSISPQADKDTSWLLLGQAGIVVMCGLLLGLVLATANTEGVTFALALEEMTALLGSLWLQ